MAAEAIVTTAVETAAIIRKVITAQEIAGNKIQLNNK
jgi:hypothetical protein